MDWLLITAQAKALRRQRFKRVIVTSLILKQLIRRDERRFVSEQAKNPLIAQGDASFKVNGDPKGPPTSFENYLRFSAKMLPARLTPDGTSS